MFTGLIQSVGRIHSIEHQPDSLLVCIDLSGLETDQIKLGDSIAVNGVCLTVIDLDKGMGKFDVSSETISKSLIGQWQENHQVNLETALTLQTPLGGHLVSGHVDGIAEVISRKELEAYTEFGFSVPLQLGRFLATKGSVCLDGVSLTVNTVKDKVRDNVSSQSEKTTHFTVMLVPHTLAHTTLHQLEPGHFVHLEIDMLARYLQRLIETQDIL